MTKYSVNTDKGNAFYLACLANIEHACGVHVSVGKNAKTDIFNVEFFAQPDQHERIMHAFQPHDAEKEAQKTIAGICYAMGNK